MAPLLNNSAGEHVRLYLLQNRNFPILFSPLCYLFWSSNIRCTYRSFITYPFTCVYVSVPMQERARSFNVHATVALDVRDHTHLHSGFSAQC